MKTILRLLCALLFFCTLSASIAQTSRFYLQLGGGYLLMDQVEQLGFDKVGTSILAYAEVGMKFRPLSVGVQHSFYQAYDFYKYSIKQQMKSIYAKYSFNQYLDWLPYGLDPYAMVGASLISSRFQTIDQLDHGAGVVLDQQIISRPGYTFGAGIQAGSRWLVFGIHYQFTPGGDQFVLQDFESRTFATGSHMLSIDIGVRLLTPARRKGSRCPRFGGKGMLHF